MCMEEGTLGSPDVREGCSGRAGRPGGLHGAGMEDEELGVPCLPQSFVLSPGV